MTFTMARPNFKKSLKMAFGPLGVKAIWSWLPLLHGIGSNILGFVGKYGKYCKKNESLNNKYVFIISF
jgi:hypothetical protein